MKYIRTKDGRIIDLDRVVYGRKVIHLKQNTFENCWAGYYWYSDDYGYEIECRDLDIINQANTIEELCDEFVFIVEGKMGMAHTMKGLTITKNSLESEGRFMSHIYGAIWTDKGLIYVAKMNEKGELELL